MIRTKAPKKNLARRIFSHGFRYFGRVSFFIFCRVHIIHVGRLPQDRAMILASNHISHFDPLLLGTFFARYVDWMAMEELFGDPLAASILDWLCAFPVTRNGRDRRAIWIALRRLGSRRTVGMFPEGGIRAGRSCMPVFPSFAGRPAKLTSGAQTRGLSPTCQASAETTLNREPASILNV